MTTERKEKLANRLQKLKTNHGVSYSHMARTVGLSNTTILSFAKGRTDVLGDEKCELLWKMTERFFPEPKARQVENNG
ncbi:MAG: hypothetical protein PWQ06_1114 [Anaerophaga sp.]|jgi:DNA-binding XRE family transcriptional regulator|nr:hypothetical protein [Anaerophaga sp.]